MTDDLPDHHAPHAHADHADGLHAPTGPADSAGQPWAGRTFDAHSTTFAGDDGSAPAELIAALARFRALAVPESSASRHELLDAQTAVIGAVRDARLLVPLLARAGEMGVDDHGRTSDKTQELAIVSVKAPDGRTVLPAFTSVEALARWNAKARPIPTPARRVALAAAGEGTDLIVLDPGSPTEFALRRPAVWAIAQDQPWHSPFADAAVARAFDGSAAGEPSVHSLALRVGDPTCRLENPEVIVELALEAGLGSEALAALLGRLQQRWSESEPIASSVDSLSIRLTQAS